MFKCVVLRTQQRPCYDERYDTRKKEFFDVFKYKASTRNYARGGEGRQIRRHGTIARGIGEERRKATHARDLYASVSEARMRHANNAYI